MDKVEKYRNVYKSFSALCAEGKQKCSFVEYCRREGVDSSNMEGVLGDEFHGIRHLPGYKMTHVGKNKETTRKYGQVYEEFKTLCTEGRQPGSFVSFCKERGIEYSRMNRYLNSRCLGVGTIPGYQRPGTPHCPQVPFEEIIFEEAGFLPAGDTNVITVSVDGHVAVRFPADTDVAVIAKFVKKMGKEAGHVES